jgi:hypothetical protein
MKNYKSKPIQYLIFSNAKNILIFENNNYKIKINSYKNDSPNGYHQAKREANIAREKQQMVEGPYGSVARTITQAKPTLDDGEIGETKIYKNKKNSKNKMLPPNVSPPVQRDPTLVQGRLQKPRRDSYSVADLKNSKIRWWEGHGNQNYKIEKNIEKIKKFIPPNVSHPAQTETTIAQGMLQEPGGDPYVVADLGEDEIRGREGLKKNNYKSAAF